MQYQICNAKIAIPDRPYQICLTKDPIKQTDKDACFLEDRGDNPRTPASLISCVFFMERRIMPDFLPDCICITAGIQQYLWKKDC